VWREDHLTAAHGLFLSLVLVIMVCVIRIVEIVATVSGFGSIHDVASFGVRILILFYAIIQLALVRGFFNDN